MGSPNDTVKDPVTDAGEQIRQLREQVEALMRERVSPILADAAGRAQDAAHQASEMVSEQAEAFSGKVREAPITSVLIAAGIGYLLGRIVR